ncbi:MAG: SLATT domain-containing protein [Rhodospirillaceae bacterium]
MSIMHRICNTISRIFNGENAAAPRPRIGDDIIAHISKPEEFEAAANKLQKIVIQMHVEMIGWYRQRLTGYRRMAKACRLAGILGFSIASLWPAFQLVGGTIWFESILDHEHTTQVGYLAAAIGGVALIVEQYSGVTSGWIRYVNACLKLERSCDDFEFKWALLPLRPSDPEVDCRPAQIAALDEALKTLWDTVTQETTEWSNAYIKDLDALRVSLRNTTDKGKGGRAHDTSPESA